MPTRLFLSLVWAVAMVLPLVGQTATHATRETPRARTKAWTLPRMADGKPDLQGIWTNTTLTPLERIPELAGKSTLTEDEATAFEKQILDRVNFDRRDGGAETDVTRAYNNLFMEWGYKTRHDQRREAHFYLCGPAGRKSSSVDSGGIGACGYSDQGYAAHGWHAEPAASGALHCGPSFDLGTANASRTIQQQLSDRADSGVCNDSRRTDP